MSPKNYWLKHTKPIFNEYNLLNLSNLYVHQTLMGMFKVMKDHSPISIYNMFNLGQRNNLRVNLPFIQLNASRYNSVNRCSLIWNKFIGKVLEKSGVLILVLH